MGSNKLQTIEKNLPLRGYPKESTEVDDTLKTVFKYWLANLLSIKADNEKKLDSALPAIKKHFWSLGFTEIKKAFEMYADGELKTKPIPNYFDRILVGQIFNEYRQQKPVIKKTLPMPEPTQKEKDDLIYHGLITCFDEFIQKGNIINGYTWVYDHLNELGIVKYSDDEKRSQMPIAESRLRAEAKEMKSLNDYKTFIRDLEAKRLKQSIINKAKNMLLERFFGGLNAKGKHLKELI